VERLLLANRLAGRSKDAVAAELLGRDPTPDGVRMKSYASYLFEQSPFLDPRTKLLAEAALPAVLRLYEQMDVAQTLGRYRVDYLYTSPGETPAEVAGWKFVPVLHTGQGTLWSLHRNGQADSAASARAR
jgi:hypothetical protein